ncbi:hypothetical protein BH23ACT5_BH23ACT5_07240 [soil metagenome]
MKGEASRRIESIVDRRIREAMEAGEFDELPGTGEPLPGAGTHDDDLWWVRGWMQRNEIDPVDIIRLTGRRPDR